MIPEALILDIQRMSTEDGPGLRTTVFFKGCSLQCAWCHNPESIAKTPYIQWDENKCIGCQSCCDVCKNGALISRDDCIKIDSVTCRQCFSCVSACPAGALKVRGECYSCEELLELLLKDRAYFGLDGGITLSGGEPLLQAEAVYWLLKELKSNGLQTALDTAGLVAESFLLNALDYTDLLLYDLKLYDESSHKKYCGSGNKQILANLLSAVEIFRAAKKKMWIRTPIIPGATDSTENIRALALLIADKMLGVVERWELCAFNNLCKSKYYLLGLDWQYKEADLIKKSKMEELTLLAQEVLTESGVKVACTGATNDENGN